MVRREEPEAGLLILEFIGLKLDNWDYKKVRLRWEESQKQNTIRLFVLGWRQMDREEIRESYSSNWKEKLFEVRSNKNIS